jgi:hypothetical protein
MVLKVLDPRLGAEGVGSLRESQSKPAESNTPLPPQVPRTAQGSVRRVAFWFAPIMFSSEKRSGS